MKYRKCAPVVTEGFHVQINCGGVRSSGALINKRVKRTSHVDLCCVCLKTDSFLHIMTLLNQTHTHRNTSSCDTLNKYNIKTVNKMSIV